MTKAIVEIQEATAHDLPFNRDVTSSTDVSATFGCPISVPKPYQQALERAIRSPRRVDWQAEASAGWPYEALKLARASFEAGAESWPDR